MTEGGRATWGGAEWFAVVFGAVLVLVNAVVLIDEIRGGFDDPEPIAAAPAFTAEELAEPPTRSPRPPSITTGASTRACRAANSRSAAA